MVNEKANGKYPRASECKGMGEDGENDWVIKDTREELKAWGHAGGTAGDITLKCDREISIVAVRDAAGKIHG